MNQPQASRPRTAVLLVNLGSPEAPTEDALRTYLDQFLMDGEVLTVPRLIRRLIVSGFILPRRPRESAKAYASIWTDEGAPLLVHSRALRTAVSEQTDTPVALAMRYGNPGMEATLQALADDGIAHLLIVPLYPHFAGSSVKTVLLEANRIVKAHGLNLTWDVLPPFYAEPGYIDALAGTIAPALTAPYDHLLFSYHGIPNAHLAREDPTGSHCLSRDDCCEVASPAHATCYRHQVRTTSRLVADRLGLDDTQWSIAYQSRLLSDRWLRPFTDYELAEMPGRGIKRLVVACPAFVADNLETLEEIGIRGRETFMEAGGESFVLTPCLNEDRAWIEILASWINARVEPENPAPA